MGIVESCKNIKTEENKEILKNTVKMAWPSVLESFLMSLTGFVDSIMVGVLGISAIASVGLTVQPRFIGMSVFIAISVAVSSLVARRRGEDDRESANKVLRTAMLLGLALVVIVSTLFVVFADFIMMICGSNADTHDNSVGYLRIVMGTLVFNVIGMIINAAQRGAGNTRISMITNMTSNVVNVICNFLLIEGRFGFPAMGVMGAATATAIGAFVACVLSVISLLKKDRFIYIAAVKSFIAEKKDLQSGLKVGVSAFLDQIFLRIGFLLFALTVANLGTIEYGSHQIGSNFMALSFAFADGLAVASVALVGRSLGQKRTDLAKKYANTCILLGFACAVFITAILMFFGMELFALFDQTPEVLEYGRMIINLLCVVMYVQIAQVTILGCLRGAGDTKYTAVVSLLSVGIARPLASYILCYPLGLGLMGVWLGLFCDQIIRLSMGWFRYKKGNWLKIKI